MAKITQKQINEFIETIAPIIVKEASARGYKYPSAIIGQAIHESGVTSKLATEYHNYWGMKCGSSWKGKSVNLKTKEVVEGKTIDTSANWRVYDTMEDGVKGYFDFIQMKRYQGAKSASSPREYITILRDNNWATGERNAYINAVMSYVNNYNLTRFDCYRAGAGYITPLKVVCSSLRIRSGAGVLFPQIGSYKKGEIITPLETRAQPDGSVWVRTNKGFCCKTLHGENYLI